MASHQVNACSSDDSQCSLCQNIIKGPTCLNPKAPEFVPSYLKGSGTDTSADGRNLVKLYPEDHKSQLQLKSVWEDLEPVAMELSTEKLENSTYVEEIMVCWNDLEVISCGHSLPEEEETLEWNLESASSDEEMSRGCNSEFCESLPKVPVNWKIQRRSLETLNQDELRHVSWNPNRVRLNHEFLMREFREGTKNVYYFNPNQMMRKRCINDLPVRYDAETLRKFQTRLIPVDDEIVFIEDRKDILLIMEDLTSYASQFYSDSYYNLFCILAVKKYTIYRSDSYSEFVVVTCGIIPKYPIYMKRAHEVCVRTCKNTEPVCYQLFHN